MGFKFRFCELLDFEFGFIKLYLTLKSGLLGVRFGLFSVEFCFIMSKKATKYFLKTSKKVKNACKERAKKVKKCLSKTIYLNQNLIKGGKSGV